MQIGFLFYSFCTHAELSLCTNDNICILSHSSHAWSAYEIWVESLIQDWGMDGWAQRWRQKHFWCKFSNFYYAKTSRRCNSQANRSWHAELSRPTYCDVSKALSLTALRASLNGTLRGFKLPCLITGPSFPSWQSTTAFWQAIGEKKWIEEH